MEETATTSFSAIQGRLLSNVHPLTISLAALRISAVSSTSAGGLPAPAPIPLFPEERTAVTSFPAYPAVHPPRFLHIL